MQPQVYLGINYMHLLKFAVYDGMLKSYSLRYCRSVTLLFYTLIRLGFFGYCTGIYLPWGAPEISAVIRAIVTKFCTRVAPDVIYMTA